MGSKTAARDVKRGRYEAMPVSNRTTGRRMRRGREKRIRRELREAIPFTEIAAQPAAPDPVQVAVLTLDHLSGASLRASFSRKEVRVVVSDAAIAAIFRAALLQTAQTRATDRLIRVVVD